MISQPETLLQSAAKAEPQVIASRPAWQRLAIIALLGLVLFMGALFRLTGVNWDQGTHLHPDERFLTMVVSSLTMPGEPGYGRVPDGCNGWGGYFNTKCSPLNPYNHDFGLFVYGTFPIFLTRFVGEVVSQTGYDEIHIVGRILSALFDLSTVLILFFIGRRVYGVRVGLLAALFLAASVLDIQQSHFFTVDTFTNVPILIAFWFALDIADGRRWTAFLWAGIAFGLALAGRINIAPFAAVLVAASALRAYNQAILSRNMNVGLETENNPDSLAAADPIPNGHENPRVIERSVGPLAVSMTWKSGAKRVERTLEEAIYHYGTRALIGLVIAAVAALVLFRTFQPYAANGPSFFTFHFPKLDLSRGPVTFLFDVALSWAGGVNPKFADNMSYVSDLVSGKIDAPPGHQWTDRPAYIFPFENMVLWGLGLPLGLAAWAGFALALYQLLRYRRFNHLLTVVWVGITFAYTGQQYVKTMRYFLQIYPFLCLLGAWLVIELWDKAKNWSSGTALVQPSRWKAFARYAAVAFAVILIGYTLFWAGAFTSIYTRSYTRVAASRWIYSNLPQGSAIGTETWDDPVPVPLDGRNAFPATPGGPGAYFTTLASSHDGQMHWYDEDTPEKRTQAIGWLDSTDYVVLSSNRLYGSIPRLPMRYPMTTKYYQWLFDGTLGFEKIAEFSSRPQLLGIEINDDDAEEAFTVYDHPKVLLYKKTPQYSHANTAALFNSVDLSEVYRFTPLLATQSKTALLLTPEEKSVQTRGGTWSEIFQPDDWINRLPVIVWLVVIEVLGWITFPISFVVLRALADRGYIFSKALGMLLPAWAVWMLASLHLVEFSRWTILLMTLVLAVLSGIVIIGNRGALYNWVRRARWIIIGEEILFLGFFALFLAIRYGNPDLWHPAFGGEKPLDFTLLNAITKSTWFPPYDAWFAGGHLDYYYFGQLITATWVKFTGIVPEEAYNLALPTYFAMTAMGAFSIVLNLTWRQDAHRENVGGIALVSILRMFLFAFLGALFVAVIGNLGELVLIGQAFLRAGGGEGQSGLAMLSGILRGVVKVASDPLTFQVPIGWYYWNATRVIPETINEFPFFTFLYADLHAHLIALPFTLLLLGFVVNLVRRDWVESGRLPFWPYWQITALDIVELVLTALVLGALRAINFADFPTYLLVVLGAIAIGEYGRRRVISVDGIVAVAWRAVVVVALANLLFQPFLSHFATAYIGVEQWKGTRTALPEFIVVHGIFLFFIATFLIVQSISTRSGQSIIAYIRGLVKHSNRLGRYLELQAALSRGTTWGSDLLILIAGGSLLIEIALIVLQHGVFALVLPLLVLASLLVLEPSLPPERRLIALLIAAALAMTLMVEVVVAKGDIGRMNTVFKFYVQVWLFLALGSAVGLAFLFRPGARSRVSPAPMRLPSLWWALAGLLVFMGMLYPVLATRAKVNDRYVANSPPGLNGMDYMQDATYTENNQNVELDTDRAAIQWLRENVQGSPVILEANGPLYHWTSRVSIHTGLPTVIGWDWHQKQQRSIIDGAIIDNRINDVRLMYTTTSVPDALRLLNRYQVSYIYVGQLERATYGPNGLGKFDTMVQVGQLALVYDQNHVKIYRVSQKS